jgi:hypothetical protein
MKLNTYPFTAIVSADPGFAIVVELVVFFKVDLASVVSKS